MLWHTLTAGDALAALQTGGEGLAPAEAARRLRERGPNELQRQEPEPWWEELLESIREPLQLLLVAVGVLYAFFGKIEDAITIFAVIVIVSIVEALNEARAKKAIASLQLLTSPHTFVVRGGVTREIPSREVVPGDIVLLQQGSRVTADVRLLESSALRIDESSLTGESAAVEKQANVVLAPATPQAERANMAYNGTSVTGGIGRGVAVATGQATEIGSIAALAAGAREARTPLQRQLDQLAGWLVWAALGLSALIPTLGVAIAGQPAREMLLSGLTLAFALIPEELPILITVVLGIGAYRLAQQQAITTRLEAAEALGSVTVVGADKTGTLTENRMRVVELFVAGRSEPPGSRSAISQRLLEIGALANDAQASGTGDGGGGAGDPTDIALLEAARPAIGSARAPIVQILSRTPFDDARRRVSTVYEQDGTRWVVTKGAPEAILALSTHIRMRNGVEPVGDSLRAEVVADAEAMGRRGLRVLAFAERELRPGESIERADADTTLTLVGLAGLEDPPRPEVAPAIAALRGAGVRVLMITGDHAVTANAIANQVGIDASRVISGPEVERTADAALGRLAQSAAIFARITPQHKLRIVRALQDAGEVVAVTGDGVNDAPALREATIGVAMGKHGTDVAREAADVVLADDNFATIAVAVRGGRVLYENLRKAVRFYLAVKVALGGSTLAAVLAGLPLPFWPVQIIVLELFMDLGASTTFVVEPAEGDVMARPPRDVRRPLLDGTMLAGIVGGGLSLALAVSVAYLWTLHGGRGVDAARTTAFTTWMVGHVWLAAHMRAERQPLVAGGLRFTWPFTVWSITAILLGTLGPVIPFINDRLNLTPIASVDYLIALSCALTFPGWLEIAKWMPWNRASAHLRAATG